LKAKDLKVGDIIEVADAGAFWQERMSVGTRVRVCGVGRTIDDAFNASNVKVCFLDGTRYGSMGNVHSLKFMCRPILRVGDEVERIRSTSSPF